MIEMERERFLYSVKMYIQKDPEAAAYVSDSVAAGLQHTLKEAREHAADMEVALSVLAAHRYKGKDALVKSKLNKWKGKTFLNWDWLTSKA